MGFLTHFVSQERLHQHIKQQHEVLTSSCLSRTSVRTQTQSLSSPRGYVQSNIAKLHIKNQKDDRSDENTTREGFLPFPAVDNSPLRIVSKEEHPRKWPTPGQSLPDPFPQPWHNNRTDPAIGGTNGTNDPALDMTDVREQYLHLRERFGESAARSLLDLEEGPWDWIPSKKGKATHG